MFKAENVTVKISAYTILRGLTIEVPSGSIVALVGRNGAGKTTTLRAIMGLISTAQGTMRLDDHDFCSLPAHERAKLGIGYLPEDRRLISGLTVEENLMIPFQALGFASREPRLGTIYRLIPEVKAVANRRAVELSGGQQKMVALGRSFVNARRLLLLDEPFEGLSVALSRKLAEVIHRFQEAEEGLSVLVAESDSKRAAMLTERTYVIERGEVVERNSVGG